MVASLVTGVHGAMEERVTGWVDELKGAIGAPATSLRPPPVRAD
jgi:hypothetical protein